MADSSIAGNGGGSGSGGGGGGNPVPGPRGNPGTSVYERYSTDNVNWHYPIRDGDVYVSKASGTNRPANSSNSWSAGARFRGEDGSPGADSTVRGPRGNAGPQGNPGSDAEVTIANMLRAIGGNPQDEQILSYEATGPTMEWEDPPASNGGGTTPPVTSHDLTYGLASAAGVPVGAASSIDVPSNGRIELLFPAITAQGTRWYFSLPNGVTLSAVYDISVGQQLVTNDWTDINGNYVNVAGAPTGSRGHYRIEVNIA